MSEANKQNGIKDNINEFEKSISKLKHEIKKLKKRQDSELEENPVDINCLKCSMDEIEETFFCIKNELKQIKNQSEQLQAQIQLSSLENDLLSIKSYLNSLKETNNLTSKDVKEISMQNSPINDAMNKTLNNLKIEFKNYTEKLVIVNVYFANSETQNYDEHKTNELDQKIYDLLEQKKKHIEKEIKEKINFEKDLEANCNDLILCLNDTHNQEQKIRLLLQQRKDKQKLIIEKNEDRFISSDSQFENKFIQMNKDERNEYFNNLVNDKSRKKFEISVRDFVVLTKDINYVDEKQFDYMIDYYKYMQFKSEYDSQIIFINLQQIDIHQLKKLLNLESFSIQYLSTKVLSDIGKRLLLYDSLLNEIGEMRFLNEKLAYSEEKHSQNQRDNLLKKSKKSYYLIYNSIYNKIDICEGTTHIESHLFDSYDIEKVFIPSTVIDIQDNAFYQCKNLTTVSLKCLNLKSIGKSAFSDCENLRSFIMPDAVKVIEDYTFKGCKKLQNIKLPNALEAINEKAFSECDSLTEIKLPNSIKKIGYGAFKKCQNLKIVVIPDVLVIYSYENEIPNDNDEISISSFTISKKCFSKCNELANVIIKEKCKTIEESAFLLCSKIQNIKINLSNGTKIES